jgi:hypothetical protein
MDCLLRRRGRVAEGGGLLNRYTFKRRIEGSNPSVSANNIIKSIIYGWSEILSHISGRDSSAFRTVQAGMKNPPEHGLIL